MKSISSRRNISSAKLFFLQTQLVYTNFCICQPDPGKKPRAETLLRFSQRNRQFLLPPFFPCTLLLLPGMHTEVPRKGLHAFPGGSAGTASPFGERVQKLYGLVIRCSNTLSPNPDAFPFLFPAPRGKFSADSPCRAFISRRRIAADGHLTFRRQISRIARGMVETGSQVDIPAPSPGRRSPGGGANGRKRPSPLQERNGRQTDACAASSSAMPGESARAAPEAMRNAPESAPACSCKPGNVCKWAEPEHSCAGQLQTAAQVRIRVRKGGNQLAGYTLVFQVFPPPRSHFLEQGMTVERVKTAALQFQQAEFLIGVMVARQQDGCTPASAHMVRKRARFCSPSA